MLVDEAHQFEELLLALVGFAEEVDFVLIILCELLDL